MKDWIVRSAASGKASALIFLIGCMPMPPAGDGSGDDGPGDGAPMTEPVWRAAFDTASAGFLSAVWGSGPNDVFVVGGQPEQGEIYHFDGTAWTKMSAPAVPLLIWVFGFGPDDVFAVGEGGGAIHYDGSSWTVMDSGTQTDLWGIWGSSPNDVWAVGGNVDTGPPILLHYDGGAWSETAVPELDRTSTALLKVWGTSASNIFAVGQTGVILFFDGQSWQQVSSGTAEDMISLWGTGPNRIVAVGGRSNGVLGVYDGTAWETQSVAPIVGLNGVFMDTSGETVAVGLLGTAGLVDPDTFTLTLETTGTDETLHGVWADGAGRYYAVGGRSSGLYTGVALVRTVEPVGSDGMSGDQTPQTPTVERRLELGVANGQPYSTLPPGGIMPVFSGGQGGHHIFASFHLTGFEPDATVLLSQSGVLADSGMAVVQPLALQATFTEATPGVNELIDRFVFLTAPLATVHDRDVILTFEASDPNDPSITVRVEQTVRMFSANLLPGS